MSFSPEQLAGAMGQITDTNGRHFAHYLDEHRLIKNKLPGREGHTTDAQAMSEFNLHMGSIMPLIRFFRSDFPQEPLSIGQLHVFSRSMMALPIYLSLRAANPVDNGALPPSVIDASHGLAGISAVTRSMMEEGTSQNMFKTTDQIYEFTEGGNFWHQNMFVEWERGNSISCPAPEITIKGVLDVMLYYSEIDETTIVLTDWGRLVSRSDIKPSMQFGQAYNLLIHGMRVRRGQFDNEELDELIETQRDLVNAALGYGEELP